MPERMEDTVEYSIGEQFADGFFAAQGSGASLQLTFGATSHRGRVRNVNEDHYAVFRRRQSHEALLTNLPRQDLPATEVNSYGMVVADGVGGSAFGHFASRFAVQKMFELAGRATSWIIRLKDFDAQQVRERIDAYAREIQRAFVEMQNEDPSLAGMGTTWTSAHIVPPHVIVAHLGDSRAYLFRGGKLQCVTRDETLAQCFIDSGMAPESVSKFKNVLMNCFGGDSDEVSAQIHMLTINAGDRLLLCSDGLTDMVPEDEIAADLARYADPQLAAAALVALALQHGGKDNVTAVIGDVTPRGG